MYDSRVPEDQENSGKEKFGAGFDEKTTHQKGLFAALRATLRGLEISLQHIVALIAAFLLPLLITGLGVPIPIAVTIGLSVVISFVIFKARNRGVPRWKLSTFTGGCWIVLCLTGYLITTLNKPAPKPAAQTLNNHQDANNSPCANVQANGPVSITCPSDQSNVGPKKEFEPSNKKPQQNANKKLDNP
jgi:hypothetical protein